MRKGSIGWRGVKKRSVENAFALLRRIKIGSKLNNFSDQRRESHWEIEMNLMSFIQSLVVSQVENNFEIVH